MPLPHSTHAHTHTHISIECSVKEQMCAVLETAARLIAKSSAEADLSLHPRRPRHPLPPPPPQPLSAAEVAPVVPPGVPSEEPRAASVAAASGLAASAAPAAPGGPSGPVACRLVRVGREAWAAHGFAAQVRWGLPLEGTRSQCSTQGPNITPVVGSEATPSLSQRPSWSTTSTPWIVDAFRGSYRYVLSLSPPLCLCGSTT